MINKLKLVLCGVGLALASLSVATLATDQALAQAQAVPGNKCQGRLLTFPAWYNGLRCVDKGIKIGGDGTPLESAIWIIALNVVEIMIQLVGYISLAFIIIGGYRYMLANGSPDGMTKARKTILNAVIGLVISLASVAVINTIVANL